MLLCDTNILIEVFRGNALIETELRSIGIDNIAVSDITRAELFYGALNKGELHTIRKYLNRFPTLHISDEISEMAVDLVEQFCLSHKLDINDAQIAATAIYHNFNLYALNIKDFAFIPNLQLHIP